jgi:hypothetical protein
MRNPEFGMNSELRIPHSAFRIPNSALPAFLALGFGLS